MKRWLAVRSICCFSRGPGLSSEYPYGSSHSAWHTHSAHIHRHTKHSYTQILKKEKKNKLIKSKHKFRHDPNFDIKTLHFTEWKCFWDWICTLNCGAQLIPVPRKLGKGIVNLRTAWTAQLRPCLTTDRVIKIKALGKGTCCEAQWPQFHPQKSDRREPTPKSCPLTFTRTLQHVRVPPVK